MNLVWTGFTHESGLFMMLFLTFLDVTPNLVHESQKWNRTCHICMKCARCDCRGRSDAQPMSTPRLGTLYALMRPFPARALTLNVMRSPQNGLIPRHNGAPAGLGRGSSNAKLSVNLSAIHCFLHCAHAMKDERPIDIARVVESQLHDA